MTDDLNELRRLAEAATPGEWRVAPEGDANYGSEPAILSSVAGKRGWKICGAHWGFGTEGGQADYAFIAAANPAAIIALLDRVERAEGLKDVIESYARDEEAARAVIPAHCQLDLPDGGDVKLHEAITRYAAEARRAAIEEAANAARPRVWPSSFSHHDVQRAILAAIRDHAAAIVEGREG